MTDRELLESAARAAGISHDGVGYLSSTGGPMNWNPLEDDGDALRLAVKMRIDVIHNEPQDHDAWVMAGDMDYVENVDGENNRSAATRRAITRAAAAIGEKVK